MLTELPTISGSAIALTDILYIVHSPSGTPESMNMLVSDHRNMLQANGLVSGTHALIQANYLSQAYIDGLTIDYITSGSIRLNPGQAFVPALNRLVIVTGTITQAFPIPVVTGTWQHVYLWENNGVPSVQVTGTVPSDPYRGRARTKSGDTAYRYLGSLLPDNGGYIYRFATNVVGGSLEMNWIWTNNILPFEVVTGMTGTTPQNISIAGIIPASGLVDELRVLGVVNAPAATAWTAGIGETILASNIAASNIQSAEMYFRVDNQSAAAEAYFFPPGPIKVSGNTIQGMVAPGTINLSVRVKGIRIPR